MSEFADKSQSQRGQDDLGQKDIKSSSLQALIPTVGIEYREKRFVLTDEALLVLETACRFPDQEDIDAAANADESNITQLVREYIERSLNFLEPSPFTLCADLNEVQEFIVESTIHATNIIPDDREKVIESILYIGQAGSAVMNQSYAQLEGLSDLLIRQEHMLILDSADKQVRGQLESGFQRAMDWIENVSVEEKEFNGQQVRNLREMMATFEDEVTLDFGAFWMNMVAENPLPSPEVTIDDLYAPHTPNIVRAAVERAMGSTRDDVFETAHSIAKAQYEEACIEAEKDMRALNRYGY